MKEKDIRLLMEISPDREIRPGWQRGVEIQRTRTIKAGNLLYCSSYPIWDTSTRRDAQERLTRAREKKGTTDAQRRLNARKAEEKLVQIINANFGAGDHLVTCTYAAGREPPDLPAAQKNMRNYMARVKRLCKRKGLPDPAYVYVTEITNSNRWGVRYHHHMVMRCGLTREEVENLWTKTHGICNTKQAQRLKEGLTGWAKYIAKQVCSESFRGGGSRPPHKGSISEGAGKAQAMTEGVDLFATRHRWAASKGLIIPQPTEADKKISRRRVEKIAQDIQRDPDLARLHLEACYPGYEVLEMNVKTSEWITGAYVRAVMCRRE